MNILVWLLCVIFGSLIGCVLGHLIWSLFNMRGLSGELIKCAECKYKNKYKYRECCQQVVRDTISLFYSKNKKIEELKQELMQCKLEKEMMHQTIEEIEFKIIEKFKDKLLSYRYGELNNLIHLTVHELDKIAKKIMENK